MDTFLFGCLDNSWWQHDLRRETLRDLGFNALTVATYQDMAQDWPTWKARLQEVDRAGYATIGHACVYNHADAQTRDVMAMTPDALARFYRGYVRRYAENLAPDLDVVDLVNEPMECGVPNLFELHALWQELAQGLPTRVRYNVRPRALVDRRYAEDVVADVEELNRRGAGISVIGVQAHIMPGLRPSEVPTWSTISAALDVLAMARIDVHISESSAPSRGAGWDSAAQRDFYLGLFDLAWKHPAVRGVWIWEPMDHVGMFCDGAGIIAADGTVKQAGEALQTFIRERTAPPAPAPRSPLCRWPWLARMMGVRCD